MTESRSHQGNIRRKIRKIRKDLAKKNEFCFDDASLTTHITSLRSHQQFLLRQLRNFTKS
jgi:hypothetical protein